MMCAQCLEKMCSRHWYTISEIKKDQLITKLLQRWLE